jgi:hypothetical protein
MTDVSLASRNSGAAEEERAPAPRWLSARETRPRLSLPAVRLLTAALVLLRVLATFALKT